MCFGNRMRLVLPFLLLWHAAPTGPGRHSCNNMFHSDQGSSSSTTGWQQLSSALVTGGTSLVQKIKRAASQPALGNVQTAAGFGEAADAVLNNSLRGHSVVNGTNLGGSSLDVAARGMGLGSLPPRKDTKGD